MSKKRQIAILAPVVLAAAGLIVFVSLQGAEPGSGSTPTPAATLAGDVASGQALYARRCMSCHGPEGRGGRAKALNPASATLRGGDATAFTENLVEIITHGRGRMPAWGDTGRLNLQEIADVASYILGLNQAGESR